MTLLKPMTSNPAYLKAGFLGFAGAGKTFTAVDLAIGARKFFGLDGPIAMYDTESGSDYVRDRVAKLTGKELLGHKSRSFTDLVAMAKECQAAGVSVLVADSMTHVWRELCDSMLAQINESFKRRGWRKTQQKLEFQDWGVIKAKWNEWTDFFLNSPMHIIICGRAGYEYDFEENDRGKKELVKTGIKMKTEGEFGFEPSLLVEMERDQNLETKAIIRRATILKDRFDLIDGKHCENPTFEFFMPHLERLKGGTHAPVDTTSRTEFTLDTDPEWHAEKKARTILCEEIQGLLVTHYPSQKAEDKAAKMALIEEFFSTRSWTQVESTSSAVLRDGLDRMRAKLEPESQPAAVRSDDPDDLPEDFGAGAA
jgi:hypothetical protein